MGNCGKHIFRRSLADLAYDILFQEVGPAQIQAFESSYHDEDYTQDPLYAYLEEGIDKLMQEVRSWCKEAYNQEQDNWNRLFPDDFSIPENGGGE